MSSGSRSVSTALATFFLTVACTLPPRTAGGQTPYLLRDLNTSAVGSWPDNIVDLGGVAYFRASSARTGEELWRSDGTAGGTWLVADIDPGDTGSSPSSLAVVGGRLYFLAQSPGSGFQLWTSDGTAAGTRLTVELDPGSGGVSWISPIVDWGGVAWFTLASAAGNAGLWRSDGTAAGTLLVKSICSGCLGPMPIALVGGRLVFRGFDPGHGWEPWVSDGTSAGTVLLADVLPGAASSLLTGWTAAFAVVAGRVLFPADDGTHGLELWTTDGTPAGTVLVSDIAPGSPSALSYWGLHTPVLGSEAYFTAQDSNVCRLWKSDGTAPGTRPILDLSWPPGVCDPITAFAASGGLLYVPLPGATGIYELWRSDGSAPGTFSLGATVGSAVSAGVGLVAFQNGVLFAGFATASGEDLWRSDGTVAGTSLAVDFDPGQTTSAVLDLARVGGQLFLSASLSQATIELFRSDGTETGTEALAGINAGASNGSFPFSPVEIADRVCMGAWGDLMATELWCSDGTPGGTARIEVPCVPGSGCFNTMDPSGDWLMVQSDTGVSGLEPWAVDPTGVAPPAALGDLCPGLCTSRPRLLGKGGKVALMSAADDEATFLASLWRTDGTLAGTRRISDAVPDEFGLGARQSGELGGFRYFAAGDASGDIELWRSDDTGPGTFEVKDINPGPGPSSPDGFVVLGDRLYFGAFDPIGGRELWSTNGNGPGTRQELDLCPGACDSGLWGLTRVGDSLYFTAYDGSDSRFYRSDGSAGGTVALATVYSQGAVWFGTPPVVARGLVFFLVWDVTSSKFVMWQTDGSSAGTRPIPGFPATPYLGFGPGLKAAGGQVWMFADDAVHGFELWRTDGSASSLVADLRPGPQSSLPTGTASWIAATPTHLVFLANDGLVGDEPWALELPAGRLLLRNDRLRSLAPTVPDKASLLPLDPVGDRYRDGLVSGEVDPDDRVASDRSRPLVFYGVDGPGTLRLARTAMGQVRLSY